MEKNAQKKEKIAGGLFWSFSERAAAQIVSAVVGIILARILDPKDYGVISIVLVFITFCDMFVTNGFGAALVQKKDATDLDFNTAFIISLLMSVLLYGILFVCAPYIAAFYNMPILTGIVKVLGLRVIITAINTIQHAGIRRSMQFKKFFFSTLIGTVVSCVVGIIMALFGYGVWALVAQYLTNTLIDTLVLSFVNEWKPKFEFSGTSAKGIFSFGGKILATNIVFTVTDEIRSLAVGKVFGPADLAYYDQGRKYPKLMIDNVNSAIQEVMLPTFSRVQDDIKELKRILRRSIGVEAYVLTPVLLGFFAISETFVSVILTDKWAEAIPYIQIFSLLYLTYPISSSCHQALLGIGRSGLVFWILLIQNVIRLVLVLIAIFYIKSVKAVALVALFTSFISLIGFGIATHNLINYKYREQAKDVLPSLVISSVMCIAVYLMQALRISGVLLLAVQILTGAVIYIILSVLFKLEPYIYLKNLLKEKLLKKNIPAN